ncbi:MAG: hypothetical protein ACRDTG_03170 [Pseudonocardiaceae bacterium]
MRPLAEARRRCCRSEPTIRPSLRPRCAGVLIEELTDREQFVLRALTGAATQREIGVSLYLSINAVKGYTKILYCKLGFTRHSQCQ